MLQQLPRRHTVSKALLAICFISKDRSNILVGAASQAEGQFLVGVENIRERYARVVCPFKINLLWLTSEAPQNKSTE